VEKASKKSKKVLKTLRALDSSPDASPAASDDDTMPDHGADPGKSPSSVSRAAQGNSPRISPSSEEDAGPAADTAAAALTKPAESISKFQSSGEEEAEDSLTVHGDEAVPASKLNTAQGTLSKFALNKSCAGASASPQASAPVPGTAATPSKHPAEVSAHPQSGASVPGTDSTPSKATPSKATPSKRGREAAGSSPGLDREQSIGAEGGVKGGTPGKRRRSLLPPAMPGQSSPQVHSTWFNATPLPNWCGKTINLGTYHAHCCKLLSYQPVLILHTHCSAA